MAKRIKLIALACLTGVVSSSAFAFVAVFPISGLVPATGEVISGRYWISDAFYNPEEISLRVGEQSCKGQLHHKADGLLYGHFTCADGRTATFVMRPNGFFVLPPNPNGRMAFPYSLLGDGQIAGQRLIIEFNTVLPAPFIFP